MKILSLSNCPLVESQGSGYVILNFVEGLRRRGHHVDVVGPERLQVLRFLRKASSHRISLGMAIHALLRIPREHYDVVEFYGAEAWLASALLKRWPRRPFLLVAHSNGLEPHCAEELMKYVGTTTCDNQPRKWFQKMEVPLEKAFTDVDGLVTVSSDDGDYALRMKYQDAAHVLAIDNSLSDTYFKKDVDFARPQVVGFCGSWTARKGTRILETDLTRVLERFPGCRVKLFGLGKEFVKEAHFPPELRARVEAIPFIESLAEFQEVYKSLSIFVLPSIYEGFGLVAAEAMACGCALVASRTGFAAGLRSREEAMLMEEPRSPFLCEAVSELLSDESMRLRVARAGYLRVQGLRWESAIDKLEETYASWLKEFRGNSA